MTPIHNIPIAEDATVTRCPSCGSTVRRIMRNGTIFDRYEKYGSRDGWRMEEINHLSPEDAEEMKALRSGKKTVALVGMASASCSLAPFDDEDVEIWALNEMHVFPWLKRASRWFQIHSERSYKRGVAKRGVVGHHDWLKENPLDIPIYLQYHSQRIPKSVAYPLRDVCDIAFGNIRRGENKIKYFTSTFAYMSGIALLDEFERVEIYGFEMNDPAEYIRQKACAEFWIGLLMGKGIEIYLPPNNPLLHSELYGGDEQGEGW